MIALALLACRGAEVPPPPVVDPLDAFVDTLASDGFVVQEGLLWFSTYDGCCDPGANCLGNNPSTPYGTLALPPAPGHEPLPVDVLAPWGTLPDPSLSRTFQLRPDEAVVWIGTTPPPAKYLSFRSYLVARYEDGFVVPTMASLGPSLNHLVLADERDVPATDVFDAPIAVVMTADANVERDIADRLVAAGYARSTIHYDRLPGDIARTGLEIDDDAFGAVIRVAIDEDPSRSEAWRADPGATVLRITPSGESTSTAPHPIPDLPARGSGTDESAWQEALLALDAAILDAFADREVVVLPAIPVWQETLTCIDTLLTCAGDIRDRYAAVSPYMTLSGSDEVAVVWGVNHERAGKASYSSFSVVTEVHGIGAAAVDSVAMVGTARHWLPDHALADDLYAMVVARDCAGRAEPCLEVPTGCPGPELEEQVRITVRAYLEPATGAAPLAEELLLDRVMKVAP